MIVFNQLPHIGPGAGWFVPIIERNEPQLATLDASVTVCAFQAGQDVVETCSGNPGVQCREEL